MLAGAVSRTTGRLASQVLGADLLTDPDWSRFILGIPGASLGGGTDEIMRNIIGERVLGLPREPAPRL
jgi:alkylation response protein AidB-like acyl-CoA dehydrogenase